MGGKDISHSKFELVEQELLPGRNSTVISDEKKAEDSFKVKKTLKTQISLTYNLSTSERLKKKKDNYN